MVGSYGLLGNVISGSILGIVIDWNSWGHDVRNYICCRRWSQGFLKKIQTDRLRDLLPEGGSLTKER